MGEADGTRFSWESGARILVQGAQYELVNRLGRSAMSEVWLASMSAGGLSQEVVLKSRLEDPGEQQPQIDEEWEIGRRLHHDNIVRTYALEQIWDRRCLVLEYVDGRSLKELLAQPRKEKSVGEKIACYVVAAVADALEYAHNLSDSDGQAVAIVHRDVKPSNIMVSWRGQVKLLDFGVAKSRLDGREETAMGKTKGTCGYQSPEQLREERLDGRSDLFSLGIVLVELLTGKRPFSAGSGFGTEQNIERCGAGDVETATEQIAPGLREICMKALARSPADRFQSGGELSRVLREHLVRQGIVYGPGECGRDLQDLANGAGEPAGDEKATGAGWTDAMAARARARGRARRQKRRGIAFSLAVTVMAGAAGSALGIVGSSWLRAHLAGSLVTAEVPRLVRGAEAVSAGERCELAPAAASAEGSAPTTFAEAAGRKPKVEREEPLMVVRPKRGGKEKTPAVRAAP
ncbi:MAG TPA: serine/threonine-protein kinase, partial [Anaeromyxobacteraceae bacterium]|nr:serine/threonine-protein kinase [Anaeromyxobacteraceae bacterium]